ncbi:MAG: hypothetical protein QOJ31_1731 [Gaiellales bacterium]|nr:hypothetical protein [Gaiellales bacterium]MDX6551047.1 hypothetical protein [Gaiellales bacterium]
MRVGARSHTSLSVNTAISAAPIWVVDSRGAPAALPATIQPRVAPLAPRANCYSTRMVVDELRLPDETTRPMMLIA